MNMRKLLDGTSLFRKKEGRDLSAKMFWKYVRNLICCVLAAVIVAFTLSPYEAFALICMDFIIMVLMGIYSMMSLRIRRIEERIEAGRQV